MKSLFFPLVAIVATGLSTRLCAEVVFSDEFNKPGSSSDSDWYVRGENLKDENNVSGGSLLLARKDREQAVPRAGGVWKSFSQVSLKEGQTLRLTAVFSGAEVESAPFFRVVLADSPNPVDSNGSILKESPPFFFYALGLTTGEASQGHPSNLGFLEVTRGTGTSSLMENLTPQDLKPIFQDPQKVLGSGQYDKKAVLVWELSNKGGVIVSKGSWTGPDGVRTDMLEVQAETVQHFDFNKVGIGFAVWDANWANDLHLAESVSIDSVKLEKL